MRPTFLAALPFALVACAPTDTPTALPATSLPLFGEGYPAAGDTCRRVGESAQTVEYLDHTADLVACPDSLDTLNTFTAETGAKEVFRQDGYVVYSILRGE